MTRDDETLGTNEAQNGDLDVAYLCAAALGGDVSALAKLEKICAERARISVPAWPTGMQIHRLDGDPRNNDIGNLELRSPK
jgi:exoribonuclease II